MKTVFLFSVIGSFAAIFVTLALELVGVSLPPSLGLGSAFGLFVISATALTAVSDYAQSAQRRRVGAIAVTKATHPLAA